MKKIFLILTIVISVFICIFSSQPASESSKLSEPISGTVADVIIAEHGGMTDAEKTNTYLHTDGVIRDYAHAFLFCALGLCFRMFLKDCKLKYKFITVFFSCALYGLLDEIKQIWVSGRTFSGIDVCMDCIGTLIGIFTAMLICWFIDRRKERA